MSAQITAGEFHSAHGVGDWRALYHAVSAHFLTGSLAEGAEFVNVIGRLEGVSTQRLTVTMRDTGVTVTMQRDVALAQRISSVARQLGLVADPAAVQLIVVTIDALSVPKVVLFWQALLRYRTIGYDYLADPTGRGPSLYFQQMDAPRPQRNRIHLDVAVPHDEAEERIAAALVVGGRLVSDEHAPKWWVLADPEGNEACVATWVGREETVVPQPVHRAAHRRPD